MFILRYQSIISHNLLLVNYIRWGIEETQQLGNTTIIFDCENLIYDENINE